MGVVLHLGCPLQKAPQIIPFAPRELPELQKADLLHFDTAIRLDPPEQVRATPWGQTVATSGVPEKSNHKSHLTEV